MRSPRHLLLTDQSIFLLLLFQMAALADIRKKWHISPAFSVEFIGYYLDRVTRSKEIKINLQQQLELNQKLASEQLALRERYDEVKNDHC